MDNRFAGTAPIVALGAVRGVPSRASSRTALLAGVAVCALACGPTGAWANCSSTIEPLVITVAGGSAVVGGEQLVPFASGGAISSLVSAINASNTAFLTQSSAFIASPPNPSPDQLGGGVWARGIGGQFTTNNAATSTYSLNGGPLAGNVTCNTTTRLDFTGVQVGTDVARLNWGGWNVHVGQTAGYMGARAKDVSGAGAANPQGGTFRNDLEVPFFGFYAAATNGGFFVDGQVRWNFYQNYLSDPVQSGLFGQRLNARGESISANIGYYLPLDGGWFVEPSAGVIWSHTSIDPLNVSGTLVLLDSTGLAPPGRVSINDIYSTLGRLGARGGVSIDAGNLVFQPFATAAVFHDFVGGQTASIETNFASLFGAGFGEINGRLNMNGLGTYGQFGGGTVIQLKDTGWLAYVRGDYRTGSRIDGWSLNGGVRYTFLPGSSVMTGRSADVAAVPIAVAHDWTGVYVGGFLGAAWGETAWTSPTFGTAVNPRFAGFTGGGGLGYNYQIGTFVLGVEGDFGWTNAKGGRSCPNGFFFTCEADMNWLSTITGRIGITPFDRLLWYFKAGLAVAEVQATFRCNTGGEILVTGLPLADGCPSRSTSKTAAGWTIGAGSEFALNDNWSVAAETNYFDLGTARYDSFGPLDPGTDIRRTGFVSRVGINYKFTDVAAPVVAKY